MGNHLRKLWRENGSREEELVHGTGESGINSIERERYFEDCEPDLIVGMFCQYFGVPEPKAVSKCHPTKLKWAGHYYAKEERMTISHNYLGLVMHELAHHVARKKGVRDSHGVEFWSILQEMHDFMR